MCAPKLCRLVTSLFDEGGTEFFQDGGGGIIMRKNLRTDYASRRCLGTTKLIWPLVRRAQK